MDKSDRAGGAGLMDSYSVRLRLNQQQLELIDNSVEAGEAASREELIRRALREFAEMHLAGSAGEPA
jgi:Arc/MetJ-type ribon-helix-helix transcriptional regulator